MKLKSGKRQYQLCENIYEESFQRVYNFTWVLFNKWESVVAMKNVLIWHMPSKGGKKEKGNNERIQMSNESKMNHKILMM